MNSPLLVEQSPNQQDCTTHCTTWPSRCTRQLRQSHFASPDGRYRAICGSIDCGCQPGIKRVSEIALPRRQCDRQEVQSVVAPSNASAGGCIK